MTGTASRGSLGIGLEPASNPGRQTILTPQVLTAATSATNQPTLGSLQVTGVRFLIAVQSVAAGASTTITITGKAPDGITAVTETTTAISTATADANGNYYYCTTNVYGSINASGITASSYVTSLVSASVTIYGIVSARYLVPAVAKFEEDYDEFSPQDMRGILDKHIRMEQLIKHVTFDITSVFYPESSQFISPSCIGNVTVPSTPASIPSVPLVLKASSSFTVLTATYTLTTQPTNPGMIITFLVAGNALAGTLTITGTAWGTGAAQSEVISVLAAVPNGTFYTVNAYASVTNITVTGFTPAATCATSGVFAYNPVYNPTNTLTPMAAEWYSGTESAVYPYLVPEELIVDYNVDKELKLQVKGVAQDKIIIGDTTVANLTNSNFPTYAQPSDFPIAGWPGLFYLDPIGGTAGATQWLDIITFKLMVKTGLKPYWTAIGQQPFNRVGRDFRETTFDAEIDFTNVINYNKYKAFQKYIIVAKFLSPYYIGVSGTTPQYKYVQFNLNARITKFEIDPKAEKVMAKLVGTCEYDSTSGYAFNMSWLNQNSPSFASM